MGYCDSRESEVCTLFQRIVSINIAIHEGQTSFTLNSNGMNVFKWPYVLDVSMRL